MIQLDKRTHSITVNKGEDAYITYSRSDYADISSLDFYFTVKPLNSTTTDDSDALLQMNPANVSFSDYDESHPNSIATIKVADSETIIPEGTYKYDLKEVNVETEKIRLCANYIVDCGVTMRV